MCACGCAPERSKDSCNNVSCYLENCFPSFIHIDNFKLIKCIALSLIANVPIK